LNAHPEALWDALELAKVIFRTFGYQLRETLKLQSADTELILHELN
jgi:hypothetical protein